MTTRSTMKAISVRGGRGDAAALTLEEVPLPEPGPGQIRMRVASAGVNRPDILQRMGLYPPPPGAPEILGLEAAGTVDAVGQGVARWREGDEVTALLGGGGYAEWACVDAGHALPRPANLSLLEAGALPETVFTVYANLFEHGALSPGERLLVHGAGSGVGVMAIRMAKAAGAKVIATARGPEKTERVRGLDPDLALDSIAGDWVERVREEGGADVVLDMVGGAVTAQNLRALNPRGRCVLIAVQAGATCEVDLRLVMSRQLVLTGSTLRPRSASEKARLAAAVEERVWPWIKEGAVRQEIDSVYPLAAASEAHLRMESGAHFGKILLTP